MRLLLFFLYAELLRSDQSALHVLIVIKADLLLSRLLLLYRHLASEVMAVCVGLDVVFVQENLFRVIVVWGGLVVERRYEVGEGLKEARH